MTAPRKRNRSPLLYPAVFLSLASLAWTTWSLVDLIGAGVWGLTVAAGADIIWGSVILAEARGLRITVGKNQRNIVPAFGWASLAVVTIFLAWHGISEGSYAMAVGGPFLPLGAKVVWALALADMRDPAALTHEEVHALARMERGMTFEEAQHDIRMRQQRMGAELLMDQVSTDFDIEVMRQDRARDLQRRAPLSLTAGPAAQPVEPAAQAPAEPVEPAGSVPTFVLGSSQAAAPEPLARPAGPEGRPFGFSAHLTAQSAQRAKAVAQVAELLAQDPGITSSQVAEELAVSPATAKRYLREARNPKPVTPPTGSQP